MDMQARESEHAPLPDMDLWEDDLKRRYPQEQAAEGSAFTDPNKPKEQFGNYEAEARDCVKEFYRLNHRYQTLDFVKQKKQQYRPGNQRTMGIWEAMEYLNTLVDDSDPDTDLSQIQHLLQTAETLRADGKPRWFILTGLVHDLGKILCLFGEPQWAVVGDTFPVGCAFSEKIVYPEFFADNPDSKVPAYQTKTGIYEEGCGLDKVHLSWGHDEYLYQVVKDYLPEEGLYMIRYHSCYPIHEEGAYAYLMDDHDKQMFEWVKAFNPYDLYSKSLQKPDVEALKPYYMELINEFFPPTLAW